MATVRNLLEGSLRLIQVLDPGEAMDAMQARDALQALNDLIESLNLEHLTNPKGNHPVEVTCTPNLDVHTIGSGGSFNVTRPVAIDKAMVTVAGSEYPIEAVGDNEWAGIPIKTLKGIPEILYYSPDAPLGQVYLWPVPDLAYDLVLWCWDSIPTYADLDTQVVLPPGYSKMLRFLLALELAPEYGREASPTVVQTALDAKAAVKRVNQASPLLSVDPAMTARGGAGLSSFLIGE